MDFSIREYNNTASDRQALVACMEKLQDHVASVDPLKRFRRLPEFGLVYTDWLLRVIRGQNGVIYFSENSGKVIGCAAGFIHEPEPKEVAEGTTRYGRVQELYVDSAHRGHGIGQALMKKCEEYFRRNGCAFVYVEVFAPNKSAHDFYHTCGYEDRDINLMKKL